MNKLCFLTVLLASTSVFAQTQGDLLTSDDMQQKFNESAQKYRTQQELEQPPVFNIEAEIEKMLPEKSSEEMRVDEVAKQLPEETMVEKPATEDVAVEEEKPVTVEILPEHAVKFDVSLQTQAAELGNVIVAIDMDNSTLSEVVNAIVSRAEKGAGPWAVKWRIKTENDHIMQERVNLTAETTFDNFMGHLLEHVNNMTGVQLFVRVFKRARIIVISDTY